MSLFGSSTKTQPVTATDALPGRDTRPFPLAGTHTVLNTPIEAAPPAGYAEAVFGMGC